MPKHLEAARSSFRLLLLVCLWMSAGPSAAATVPGFDRPVELVAREQPVERFLEELFSQIDVPVIVDEAVNGSVNGDFNKSAAAAYQDIRASFQLTLYYDGAVAHVYPASDTSRNLLYVKPSVGSKVLQTATELELIDERNQLEPTNVGLVATGTRRFLEQVQELADAVESSVTDFVSPETYRVFKLRYGWADDVTLVVGGQEVIVPGVASLLRDLIDPGPVSAPSGVQRTRQSPARPGLRGQGLQSVGEDADEGSGADTTTNTQQSVDELPPQGKAECRTSAGRFRWLQQAHADCCRLIAQCSGGA